MRELYLQRTFSGGSRELIDKANAIIEEYQDQGFTLTLRQLYYQFVARALIANKQTEYKRLGSIINDARLAGEIDWEAIEDRTREIEEDAFWSHPRDVLEAVAEQYLEDVWANQPVRFMVRIEKDALLGVIERVCKQYRVPYIACRGYSSQSELWRAGKRILNHFDEFGQNTVVLYLGDHDPSGVDMTRDNIDRLKMFSLGHAEVRRVALNMDQVRRYKPPPNPAKMTDSRAETYVAEHGRSSWELDALDPRVIERAIEREIVKEIDPVEWAAAVDRVEKQRSRLRDLGSKWDEMFEGKKKGRKR